MACLGFATLGGVLGFAVWAHRDKSEREEHVAGDSAPARTTRYIGYSLLAAFITMLLFTYMSATGDKRTQEWFDLYKSGFLFLAGTLTTVIGYYFGSKGTQEAQETASLATNQAQQEALRRQELEAEVAKAIQQAQESAKKVEAAATTQKPTVDTNEIQIPK